MMVTIPACASPLVLLLLVGLAGNGWGAPREFTVPLVATGPALKGDLSDPVWQQAARLTGLVALDEGAPPEATTEVYVLGDSEALYVAFVCHEPTMDHLVSETSGHGGPVLGDDCVRVVIDPARGGVWAWHWAAHSIGAIWNALETPARTHREAISRPEGAGGQSADYSDMGASPLLATPEMTAALWVRIDDLAGAFVLLEKFVWQQARYYLKNHPPEGRLYGEVFDGNEGRRIVEFAGLTAGRWHHLALTADGQTLTAYVDGAPVNSTPAGPVIASAEPLLVGRGWQGVAVRDIRIYAAALSTDEVATLARWASEEAQP